MALMGWHGEPLLLGSPEEIPSRQFWGWGSYDGTLWNQGTKIPKKNR